MDTSSKASRSDASEFGAFARRVVKAYARRVASGDVEALPELLEFQDAVNEAVAEAVGGLRGFGYSWSELASRLGVSPQAVQQRWGGQVRRKVAEEIAADLYGLAGDYPADTGEADVYADAARVSLEHARPPADTSWVEVTE